MSSDSAALKASVLFGCRSAYEGERSDRSPATGDDIADRLTSLQEDLADPKCVELVIFGDSFPTQVWRKVHGTD